MCVVDGFRYNSSALLSCLLWREEGRMWVSAETRTAESVEKVSSTLSAAPPPWYSLILAVKSRASHMHRAGHYSKRSWRFALYEINLQNKLFFIKMSKRGKNSSWLFQISSRNFPMFSHVHGWFLTLRPFRLLGWHLFSNISVLWVYFPHCHVALCEPSGEGNTPEWLRLPPPKTYFVSKWLRFESLCTEPAAGPLAVYFCMNPAIVIKRVGAGWEERSSERGERKRMCQLFQFSSYFLFG